MLHRRDFMKKQELERPTWKFTTICRVLLLMLVISNGLFSGFMLQTQQTNPSFWITHSTAKIFKDNTGTDPLSTAPLDSSFLQMYAAKGSLESFQVVVSAGSSDLPSLRIQVSDLLGPNGTVISNENIKVFLEYYVRVRSETYYESVLDYEKGEYPDALIPLVNSFSVNAKENQPLWVSIRIPSNAPAGNYSGSISVTGDLIEMVQFSIEVFDYTLPKTTGLFNPAYVDFWELEELQDLTDQDFATQIEIYSKFFIDREISPTDTYDVFDVLPRKTDQGQWMFEEWWESYSVIATLLSVSQNPIVLRVPLSLEDLGIDYYGAHKESSQGQYLSFLSDFKHFLLSKNLTRSNGYEWFIWIEELDEPSDEYAAWLLAKYAYLTWQASDEQVFFHYRIDGSIDWESQAVAIDLEKDTTDFTDLTDSFSILVSPQEDFEFSPDYLSQAIAKKRKVLIYQQAWTALEKGDEDIPPLAEDRDYEFPSLPGIVNPALFHRILPWIAWKYNASGIGFWSVMAWYDAKHDTMINVWEDDPALWISGGLFGVQAQNGDGWLIYPGHLVPQDSNQPPVNGPVSSLRLELFRKGLEDYKYLATLRFSLLNLTGEKRETALSLLGRVNSLIHSISNFERSVSKYEETLTLIKQFFATLNTTSLSYPTVSWDVPWAASDILSPAPAPDNTDDLYYLIGIVIVVLGMFILLVILKKRRRR